MVSTQGCTLARNKMNHSLLLLNRNGYIRGGCLRKLEDVSDIPLDWESCEAERIGCFIFSIPDNKS